MNFTEIGQTLIEELQKNMAEGQNAAKIAEGAIQGVQLYHQRLAAAETAPVEQVEEVEAEVVNASTKSPARKKAKRN